MYFNFPDVADFPDNHEPRFPDGLDYSFPTVPDAGVFGDSLKSLNSLVSEVMEFGEEELVIQAEQTGRIWKAAQLYYNLPYRNDDTLLGQRGLIADYVRGDNLMGIFKDDIEELLAQEPYEPKIDQIDHAKLRKDDEAKQAVAEHLGVMLDDAQRYAGHEVGVDSVTVHVSRPTDRHHYQQFRDCETTTKLLNLHFDPKPGVLKALIYLNWVDKDNGPFQTIPDSWNWEYDDIQRIFAWGNSIGNYCHTPAHRRVANSYPKRFRGNAVFGRLIPDETTLSRLLVEGLVTWTSEVANTFVFDPVFLAHRGGQCKTGTRVNLQVRLR
jgi:hypothetical protein